MKLNMGCGRNHQPGYVNVDASPACNPDQVWDLEDAPWPWPDNSVDHVLFIHSLEHMGGDPAVFLSIMKELYRICAPGAEVLIHVPHPRHDNFLNDPTHVRPITRQMLSLFDRSKNEQWIAQGAVNTPLALYTGVDFEVIRDTIVLDEPYNSQLREGQITSEQATELVHSRINVASEIRLTLRVRKGAVVVA